MFSDDYRYVQGRMHSARFTIERSYRKESLYRSINPGSLQTADGLRDMKWARFAVEAVWAAA